MRRVKKTSDAFDPEKLVKGTLLVVKVPPFYDREYLYEVSGAGGKLLRASLYHSPKVKKQWTFADLSILFANGMIRFASEQDQARLSPGKESPEELSLDDTGAGD